MSQQNKPENSNQQSQPSQGAQVVEYEYAYFANKTRNPTKGTSNERTNYWDARQGIRITRDMRFPCTLIGEATAGPAKGYVVQVPWHSVTFAPPVQQKKAG